MHAWQKKEVVQNFLSGVRAALPLANEQLQVMLQVIRAAHPAGIQTFLDLGCGDGMLGRLLLTDYPEARGVFIDFSEPMLEVAKTKLDLDRHVCLLADLNADSWRETLPADFVPFDVIVSGYAIHHLTHERKQSIYRAVYDLLKTGGIFINVEHVASPDEWTDRLFTESLIDGLFANPENTQTRAEISAHIYSQDADDGDICASVEEQCAWLREIGFTHVDCYMKIYALAVFGGVKP